MPKIRKEQILGTNFSYTGHRLSYWFESMKRLDVTRVEFYGCSPHCYLYDITPERAYSLSRQLKENGLEVCVFTAEQCNYPISTAINDYRVRERSIQYYEKALDVASVLESPYMQMVTGGGYIGDDPEENFQRTADAMYRIIKRAEKLGITIVLESDPTTSVASMADVERLMKIINSPNLEALIDTNGIMGSGEDFEEVLSRFGDHVKHMHFIDAIGPQHCLIPGTGNLPLEKDFEIMEKYGYTGTLTPELWGDRYNSWCEEAMRQSLEFLRSRAE
ncbi:MAG: sugar phosphate isomerase/epimerase [Oscillospiraceae bacterium]|nr:sugar phosphate isomerase/epimerase [Oscillospiraceae bacterium]